MKDGSVLLSRVGSTFEESQLIANWLTMLTGAEGSIDEAYIRPRIFFKAEQAQKIRETLKNYAPKSRIHLFNKELWDVSAIRSSRTELQLGKGIDQSEGEKEKAMA